MKLLTLIIAVFIMAQRLETKKSHKIRRGPPSKAVKRAEETGVDKMEEKLRNQRSLRLASNAVKQAEETAVDKTGEKSRKLRSLGLASMAVKRAEETAVDRTGENSRNLRSLRLASKTIRQAEETAAEKTNAENLKDQSDSSRSMAYYGWRKAKKKIPGLHGVN